MLQYSYTEKNHKMRLYFDLTTKSVLVLINTQPITKSQPKTKLLPVAGEAAAVERGALRAVSTCLSVAGSAPAEARASVELRAGRAASARPAALRRVDRGASRLPSPEPFTGSLEMISSGQENSLYFRDADRPEIPQSSSNITGLPENLNQISI